MDNKNTIDRDLLERFVYFLLKRAIPSSVTARVCRTINLALFLFFAYKVFELDNNNFPLALAALIAFINGEYPFVYWMIIAILSLTLFIVLITMSKLLVTNYTLEQELQKYTKNLRSGE